MAALNTVGQRWRFRRNICIAVLHRAGMSQRVLSDVFDLPRSRIAAIVKEMTEDAPETGRGPKVLERSDFRGWTQAKIAKSGRKPLPYRP